MEWTDLIIEISSKDVDIVSDILQITAKAGFYIEDYSDFEENIKEFGPVEIVDEDLLKKDRARACIHVYIEPDESPLEAASFIEERLKSENIKYIINSKRIKEEDWANNWKKYFKPIEIGKRITIKPTWENYDNKDDRVVVEIDPSMSFGSGQHETTRLCMALLEDYVDKDTKMLDVGTGSGILAIEALLLGAKEVTAVDIDPLSVRVAEENAILNGVRERIEIKQSDLSNGILGKYNLITANIVADIIIRLLDDIDRIITADGIFIASGVIDIREEDVIRELKAKNFEIIETKYERGWVALAARKVSV